jgi:hypothetical protein
MTGFAGSIQVFEGTEVASGALARYLDSTVVATIACNLSVLALQADGMGKALIQTQGRPGLTVACRVGTKARIVGAKAYLTMAFGARLVYLETVSAHKSAVQV